MQTSHEDEDEDIEWCNLRWHDANRAAAPRVMLIGDSIANAYSYAAGNVLAGKATYSLLATSRSLAAPALIKETAYAMEGYEHAAVHFNNGLHGERLTQAQYAAALRSYIGLLGRLAPKARLIWGSSTPIVRQDGELDDDRNEMVLRRNAVAAEIMHEQCIPVNDLYALAVGRKEFQSGDTVHFNERGSIFLGEAVGRAILAAMGW